MTAAVAGGATPPVESGSIYDIGYRKYDGPRLGRAHAIRALFWHSLRSSFGIGRGGRAKVAPFILGFLASIPALAIVSAQALIRQFPGGEAFEGRLPIRYDTYAGSIGILVVLFCAAQAPELFGRDQRFALHSLYFSRALRREDYALARLAGFMVAVFLLQFVPQVLLFLGQVLLATDIVRGATDDLPELATAAAQAAITAGLLGGLSMTISAFTPRRAYAVAGIIALFVIPNIVAGIVVAVGSLDLGRWLVLLSPTSVLAGTNAILFDEPLESQFEGVTLGIPAVAYVAAAAAGIVGSLGVTIRRLLGLTA
jgi:ABC-2 type transport system permease protein